MKTIRCAFAGVVACSLITLGSTARADDTIVTASVQALQSLGGLANVPGNADFRVYLQGVSACPGANDPTWAYINANDPNYKVVVSTASTAYAMGKPVTIMSRLTTIGDGKYCQIVWLMTAS